MTYSQIQQIDNYLTDIQKLKHAKLADAELYSKAKTLDAQLRSAIKEYVPHGISWQKAENSISYPTYYKENVLNNNIDIMFAALHSVWIAIPNRDKILEVGLDIDYGYSLKVAVQSDKIEYIRKIVEKYSYEINVNKDIAEIVNNSSSIECCKELQVNKAYYFVLSELEKYLMLLSNGKDVKEGSNMQQININNNLSGGKAIANAAAEANIKVDMSVQIEQTLEQVRDACLKPEEEAAILAKLEEIKEIASEKNKKTRWEKLKGVFKWLAEQSFQAAAWIIPLVFQLIQNT